MHIRHVTLTTGHARDSLAGEVSPSALARAQAIIVGFASGEVSEPTPVMPGYSVTGRASGRCLVATVYADGPPSELVATIGVATHSRCGASLWRNLHQWGRTPVVTDPTRCPPEPWVAVALDEGAAPHEDAMHWLGDFERCLAWAWVSARGVNR